MVPTHVPTGREAPRAPPYADLAQIQSSVGILDAVGADVLETIAEDCLELLGTSCAIFETNGDHALRIFRSGCCLLTDADTGRLCGAGSLGGSLGSENWDCRQSCWDASRESMRTGAPVDVPCGAGTRLYAVPIFAGADVVGSMSFAYGSPPRDPGPPVERAGKSSAGSEDPERPADVHLPPSPDAVETARRRLLQSAKLIGEITARRRAEATLRESELRLKFLADAVPQHIWITRPDGFHESFSQRWYDYTGLSLEASQGDGWSTALHPDDQQRARNQWRHSLETGEPYEIEYRFRRHDGQYRWFLGQALPYRNETGEIVRWFGTLTDIHDRYEAAAERDVLLGRLLRTQERYDLVARATNDVIWEWDLTTGELLWNEALESTFGYALDSVPASFEFWSENVHPADRDLVVDSIHSAIERGEAYWAAEYRFLCADGRAAPVLDRGYIVHDSSGRAVRMTGSIVDLSERQRMLAAEREARAAADAARAAAERTAAALAEREQEFRAMADNIPQLAWMADATGWIYWFNQRWYEYTGTTIDEMQGWGWRGVHHPDYVDQVVKRLQLSWDSGEPWEDTFPLRSRDGEWRWFLSRAAPIRNGDGAVIRWFGTNTDITDQRAAEAERERLHQAEHAARAEAEAANRAKMEFLSTMSHDLRTPLNAIGGYTDLIEMGIHGPITPAQRVALARITANQQYLLILINDVLAFAKLEAGRIEFDLVPLTMSHVLETIEPLVAPLAQARGIALSYTCDPTIQALGDGERVRQILLNLVGNAIKFTQEGGWVMLSCDVTEGGTHIRVRDNGPGIAGDQQQRIFDPFVQADRRLNRPLEGVGLGLAISRGLAHGMGGELEVDSAPGQGATFTLTLRPVGSSSHMQTETP